MQINYAKSHIYFILYIFILLNISSLVFLISLFLSTLSSYYLFASVHNTHPSNISWSQAKVLSLSLSTELTVVFFLKFSIFKLSSFGIQSEKPL